MNQYEIINLYKLINICLPTYNKYIQNTYWMDKLGNVCLKATFSYCVSSFLQEKPRGCTNFEEFLLYKIKHFHL